MGGSLGLLRVAQEPVSYNEVRDYGDRDLYEELHLLYTHFRHSSTSS